MTDVPNVAGELLAKLDAELAAIAEATGNRPLSIAGRPSIAAELAKRIGQHNAAVQAWQAQGEAVKAAIGKLADLDAKGGAIIDGAAKLK
ncbi:MAG: hypothetical protein K8T25_17635, partial [Planctomycetia bacterium]|nr:hypothetical protein [Planctomycetia bacterium]